MLRGGNVKILSKYAPPVNTINRLHNSSEYISFISTIVYDINRKNSIHFSDF